MESGGCNERNGRSRECLANSESEGIGSGLIGPKISVNLILVER